ncbi:MAG: TMEM165/GDT1 family protein [Dictyoglomus sp.]
MEIKHKLEVFFMVFGIIFLAELGDKTQLAVLTLSVKTKSPFWVFLGASLALTVLSFIGAYLGEVLTRYIPRDIFEKIVGLIFIIVGILTIFKK